MPASLRSLMLLCLGVSLLVACALAPPPGAISQPTEPARPAKVQTVLPASTAEPLISPAPKTLPLFPTPGSEGNSGIYLEGVQISALENNPAQVMLNLTGSLPTPCHKLKVKISDPDSQNRIYVVVSASVDARAKCIQVISPFETSILLGTFSPGVYTVWVNGAQVGEFNAP